jgi:hypothetical protein
MSPSEGSDMSTSLSETSSIRGWDMVGCELVVLD